MTTEYIDPRKEPNKWLLAVLNRCVDDDDQESKEALKDALFIFASWLEPSSVDFLFAHWIVDYCSLLDGHESNRNTVDPPCSPVDPPE